MARKMGEQDDALLRRLSAANPQPVERFSGYAGSEEAREAFARVLAECVEPPLRSRARRARWPRLVWVGIASALLAAAVALLGVCLVTRDTPAQVTATSGRSTSATSGYAALTTGAPGTTLPTVPGQEIAGTSASSPTPSQGVVPFSPAAGVVTGPPIAVPRQEALEGILQLAREIGDPRTLYPFPIELTPLDQLVREATEIGVLRVSEGPDYRLQLAVTKRDYVLWLWRAFGNRLAMSPSNVSPSGLGSLSAEDQLAVAGLVRAGILQDFLAPDYAENRPLWEGEEHALLRILGKKLTSGR
jgi:hypothetical protein